MMRQYLGIKARHPDALLFYRMGDFYELFLKDAEQAAPILGIALTTRDRGKPDAVPMCGVPVHAASTYVKKLTDHGCRVAICEQVEDSRKTGGRRLVKREVIEVITPGLAGDPEGLDASREVAVAALWGGESGWGLAALDASTGNFRATAAPNAPGGLPGELLDELGRIAPREILICEDADAAQETLVREKLSHVSLTRIPAEGFRPGQAPCQPHGFDPHGRGAELCAAAGILHYVALQQPAALEQAPRLRCYGLGESMILDAATRRHLELFENALDRSRHGTLLDRIDEAVTPLGSRLLRRFLAYPLLDPAAIRERQDAVAWLADRDRARGRLRDALGGVRDLERTLARCIRPGAEPRDLAALRSSLEALPEVVETLSPSTSEPLPEPAEPLPEPAEPLPLRLPRTPEPLPFQLPRPLPTLCSLLTDALVEDPKALPRGSRGAGQTGFIREGFRPALDALREAARKGREWIVGLESRERDRLGVQSLRVRFHPVHGYSLEVSKAKLDRIPSDYERKQTLANAERFTTPELREMESRVLGANERAAALEREIFEEVRQAALAASTEIREAAEAVARIDVLQSLAEVARRDGWVRPQVDAGQRLEIRAGRHPVVEAMLTQRAAGEFVPNDATLDPDETRILLITGPNMSGKSTYLRQVALLVLLAQMGSFVPAEQARIGIVDRVFTRVGASDRLTEGESTFMVEMRETAEILAQASHRSLIILDEIGRGTSTFDGLSIAWAVAEYLHDTPGLGARTLFATHYHELADLARTREGVRNAHFEAREWRDDVVFLRRLVPGEASRSYGIQVARLAGLPSAVVARAQELLGELERGEIDAAGVPRLADPPLEASPTPQLALFGLGHEEDPVARAALDTLRAVDLDGTTPREAHALLAQLQERLQKEGAGS